MRRAPHAKCGVEPVLDSNRAHARPPKQQQGAIPLRTRMNMDDKNLLEKGFTLIELLVVVAILGILAAVAIFAVGNLTKDANKNSCATEATTVETASDAWKATHNGTAATLAQLSDASVGGNLKKAPAFQGTGADKYVYNADGTITRGANC